MKDALSYQVQQLLKQNDIIIDFDELAFQIKSHPTYPSLHAITGVLDHFNIENLALDVPITSDTLDQLPKTFLAQIEINTHKQFAVITKSKNNYQIILDSKNKKDITQSEFLEQFTGILLAVDKDESNLDTPNSDKSSLLFKGSIITSVILFGLLLINSNSAISNYLFFFLSAVGVYITAIILKQEQGEPTKLGNAFCSNPTEKKNCNAVLSSKGATIVGSLKLSDLSLIYFTGLTLATFVLAIGNISIFIPKLISIIALPITAYSIYYQSAIIKKWCFLCLCVVGLMWIQAGVSIAYFMPNYQITSIFITVLSFTSVSALWLMTSKLYKNNKALNTFKVEYFKFKRNFELFNTQLGKSQIINTQIENTEEIIFGNNKSPFNITIISNPMCGHCKAVHKLANQIIKRYANSVKLTIRFNVDPKHIESSAVKITTRLLELYHIEGREKCLKAMDDIYGDKSSEEWLNKWTNCIHPKTYLSILENEHSWCNSNAINFTPEILINGQSYPKLYNREDLIYFIEDLLEQFETSNYKIPFLKTEGV